MLIVRWSLVQISVLLLSACFLAPQKVPVPQGNIVDAKNVEQLQLGMNKSQVRFLLGNPMIVDTFHPNRWDYVNHRDLNKPDPTTRITLYFEGDQLAKIDRAGDITAKPQDDEPEEVRKD